MVAVLGIVRGHRGAIKIYGEVKRRTTFKILFPVGADGTRRHHARGAQTVDDVWQGSGTVLLVDDEETVRVVGKELLQRLGFTVLTAEDGRVAAEVFRKHNADIRCVLLDLMMPHWDGEQTFRELRRIRPEVQVNLCSGYNEQDATQRFAGKGLAGLIQKPCNSKKYETNLQAVLG